ncbi:serine O-acetyltransferase [Liberiplasma polymorphum]|uniref:serine O-acetyltransferase n=1 Tax=Liberiplasma polymorphum TaxID=3374570 RepID=UPI0037709240
MSKLLFLQRLSYRFYKWKIPLIPKMITRAIRILYSAEIPYTVKIFKDVKFHHGGLGVVVHPRAIIGHKCQIYQHVTIGSRNNLGPPVLKNEIIVGANSTILGNIVIGNNVKIGANTIVLDDIPDNATVVGQKSRVLLKND